MANVGWSKKTWIDKVTPPPEGEFARWSTKADFAYAALHQAIVTGVLEPGQQINPKQVAADLGMSIIPVREAMRRLEHDGLMVIRPYLGAEVKELPVEELCENLLIRSELESLAAELAAPLVTEAILAALEDQLDQQQACLAQQRFDEFGALNRDFHMTMYDVIRERRLVKLIDHIWDQVPRAASVFTLVPGHAVVAYEEHLVIMEALRNRDADRIKALIRSHKRRGSAAAATVLSPPDARPTLASA